MTMSRVRSVALEALLVGIFATLVALAANAVSPFGLRLGRDYFPRASGEPAVATEANAMAGVAAVPHAVGQENTSARLSRQGLSVASLDEVSAWWRDPQYQSGLIVFVDARAAEKYRAAHIPGAWAFDHYRVEAELPRVLPACLAASKVVVYCAGGECEDSEFAALMLRDAGVPAENLFVFVEGMAGWTAKRLPLEAGERGSGETPAAAR